MGKVHFPLVNIRKDVINSWHMKHYSGETAEEVEVPTSPNEFGYYTAFLKEIPDAGTTTKDITTTAPKISGLTEYKGEPVDTNTKRLRISPTQFYVNYQVGEILFHSAQAGRKLKVDYFGKGSLIEAEDINYLHQVIESLSKEQDVPEFTSFTIEGYENNNRLEVGDSFPKLAYARFKWEMTFPDRIQEGSIVIKNLTTNSVIASEVENSGEIDIDFTDTTTYSSPGELEFQISAVGINGDPLEKTFKLIWVDRIYWGVSPSKLIEPEQVKNFNRSELLKSTERNRLEELKFLRAIHHYKCFAIPKRYSVRDVVDMSTSLSFIMDDPFELVIKNQFNLDIPYNVYCSTYPIEPAINLLVTMGGEE